MGAPRVAARLNVLCVSRACVDDERESPSIAAASAAAVSAAAAPAPPPPPSPPGASPGALMCVRRPRTPRVHVCTLNESGGAGTHDSSATLLEKASEVEPSPLPTKGFFTRHDELFTVWVVTGLATGTVLLGVPVDRLTQPFVVSEQNSTPEGRGETVQRYTLLCHSLCPGRRLH